MLLAVKKLHHIIFLFSLQIFIKYRQKFESYYFSQVIHINDAYLGQFIYNE